MVDELGAAKAERQKLQAKLAELGKARAKAGEPVAALEREEEVAARREEEVAARIALDVAIASWLHGGSIGPRPREGDLNGHTPPELSTARRAAADALPELEKLAAEEREVRKKLDAAQIAIIDLAAEKQAANFKALAKRAHTIRAELAEIEAELGAGFHFFSGESDHHFAMTGERNPALLMPKEAALAGFDEERARIRNVPTPDRRRLARQSETFAQLKE
jgi:hypothetical protein